MINTDGTVVDLYIPRKWYARFATLMQRIRVFSQLSSRCGSWL
jgi:hypothetical protein